LARAVVDPERVSSRTTSETISEAVDPTTTESVEGEAEHTGADAASLATQGNVAVQGLLDEPGKFERLFKQRYRGKAPRYGSYVDRGNAAEIELRRLLPEVVAYTNGAIPGLVGADEAFTVDELEIATTFLAEGGEQWMHFDQQQAGAIIDTPDGRKLPIMAQGVHLWSGSHFFISSEIDRSGNPQPKSPEVQKKLDKAHAAIAEIKPWLHPCVHDYTGLGGPRDKGGFAHAATLRAYLYGIAGCYAHAKHETRRAYRSIVHAPLDEVDRAKQFFWVSFFYNGGGPQGRKMLRETLGQVDSAAWVRRYGAEEKNRRIYGRHELDAYHHALQRTAGYERLDGKKVDGELED
jgi:hypothetical protein